MNIAGVEIGPGQPCRIIAELSNNHNGSPENACRLIRECADAGADFIKFQCYTPDELVSLRGDGPAPDPWGSDGWTMRDLYEKARTPHEWFPKLVQECEAMGIPWFSSVFGPDSMCLLLSLGCPALKVAALDVEHEYMAVALAGSWVLRYNRPVIASSRGERIPWADLTLYCPPGYPQPEVDFSFIKRGECDGFSSHATSTALAFHAIAAGATLIEVHVQLDDVPSELEANVSLTVSQLRELCEAV